MWRVPRKTVHSDARASYETVHEMVCQRLSNDDLVEYLNDIAPFIARLSELSTCESRQMYLDVAGEWLNSQESKCFLDISPTLQTIPQNWCENCAAETEFMVDRTRTFQTCITCGVQVLFRGELQEWQLEYQQEKPTQSGPYRRSNHFSEWLRSFMACNSKHIPDDVFQKIETELKKHRITDRSALDQKRLRVIMKSLRLSSYYESAPFILYRLKGQPAPQLSEALKDELIKAFELIQEPFERAKEKVAPDRKNFLSYAYTIRKLLELMEVDNLVDQFPLLKSREKLIVQDKIWKCICMELGWTFSPSC